jgi:IclR family KDG regulon transcriptional repressor
MMLFAMAAPKQVNTIVHASRILKCLSQDIGRLTDISKALGLHKPTVHRALKTLESEEFVVQDPVSRRYHLGPTIHRLLSNPIIGHHSLIQHSRKELEYLRDISGETTGLQIQMGYSRMALEEVQSLQPIRLFGFKGHTRPIYTGGPGKVLLAQLNDNELKILMKNIQLIPIGPKTIIDKKLLMNEVEKARELGYATGLNDTIEGVATIAVPVKNYLCPVALGIVGPENRFSYMDFLDELKKCALNISKNLSEVYTTDKLEK